MNPRVLSIIAGAALAFAASAAAAASDPAKPASETDKPKAVADAKEPAGGHPQGAQQNKMKHCNEEARKKELKGDERRAFMSTCLKAA